MSLRPGEARLDAEGAAGLDDHTLLPVQIVLRRGQAEREIQISHIVIHSAAAGEAAGELPAVLLQKRRAALLPGILIPADDHGMAVLPQIEDAGIRRDRIGQVLLQREVMIRIGVVRAEVQQLPGSCARPPQDGIAGSLHLIRTADLRMMRRSVHVFRVLVAELIELAENFRRLVERFPTLGLRRARA